MFPTLCRTDVRRMYLVHSEFTPIQKSRYTAINNATQNTTFVTRNNLPFYSTFRATTLSQTAVKNFTWRYSNVSLKHFAYQNLTLR